MTKDARQKTIDFVKKSLQKEHDKWDAGMKNELADWEMWSEQFLNATTLLKEANEDKQDMRVYINSLEKEVKTLKGQLAEYHSVLEVQKKQIKDLETRLEVYRK